MDEIIIIVGSNNKAKIQATSDAFHCIFNNRGVIVHSLDVASGVSQQPMGDKETLEGATTRAKSAYSEYFKINNIKPHYAVGIEGGVGASICPIFIEREEETEKDREMECFAWTVIW
eukprot:CAMPEP_0182420412 /NCGR_PEP_ID=MMETSP1167-20130531/5160_1 /TAXON_ID=2988 /ORGANISM="Mallomonas Sp, Strain CCMP3275" /LENGTH=116 /DNA_ID=CAMNT_0024596317 /DNA_START=93 /DNA_END=440 /DNA_ORIENTATION=-